jgi:hypothetical protein
LSTVKIARYYEDQHGCNGWEDTDPRVTVCFKTSNDQIWVKDGQKDGLSATAKVYAAFVGGPGGTEYRYCRNSLGVGNWGVCDYDMDEQTYVDYWGGTQDGANGEWIRRTNGMIESVCGC